MANIPFVGDVGLKLIITVVNASDGLPKNISQTTMKKIIVKKPNGTSFTRNIEFVSDGADGQLQYVSIAGDLSVIGTYLCQINLVLPDWNGSTSPFTFSVRATI